MVRATLFGALLSALAGGTVSHADEALPLGTARDCGPGWVFFDLGNTLVRVQDPEPMRYMEGTLKYLRDIREAGYHLGLITNIPEGWGQTDEERIAALKQEIALSWDKALAPFAWELFEQILVPAARAERKPQPTLYLRARAGHEGCWLAFEGEDRLEVDAAVRNGFDRGFVVGSDPGAFYPPVADFRPAPPADEGAH